MKKLLSMFLVMTLILSCTGCAGGSGQKPSESAAASTGGTSDPSPADDPGTEHSEVDIVLMIPNSLGDKAFSDMIWNGIGMAKEEYSLGNIKCIELQGDTSTPIPTLTELCDSRDWDIIVTGTFSLKESIQNVAEKYPEQTFIIYDTNLDYDGGRFTNCISYAAMQNEGSFLAGALGAKMTESGVIGFVGGKETTSVSDFLVGYIEGAQYVNPDIKVYSSFIGSFTDTSTAKELALAQYGQGADVIFAVCAGAGLGVYNAAKEKGFSAIGVDSDQALILEETDPGAADQVITSVVKNMDVMLKEAVKEYLDGSLALGTHVNVNLAAGGIGLADNQYYQKHVPADIRAEVNQLAEKIASGEITVSTAVGMDADTYAALKASVQ